MDAVHNVILEATIAYYDTHKPPYDAYKQATLEALKAVDLLPEVKGSGPLSRSLYDILTFEEHGDFLTALQQPFRGKNFIYPRSFFGDAPDIADFEEHKDWERERKEWNRDDDKYLASLRERNPLLALYETALRGTPLYPYQGALQNALREVLFPYQFPDPLRFRGHLIVGAHGTGKTTYLSNLILSDIERVKERSCSVVVIDSQETLIPQLARLKVFAPGEALEGRLVYIEPDEEHPIALNILDTPLNRGALQLINFFMKSVALIDTTSHMDTILAHVVPAVMSIPGATIFTLQQFMRKGYEAFQAKLQIEPDEHEWLSERLKASEYKMTIAALNARLDAFTSDPFFKRMFSTEKSRFDLFVELQSSKVILINTSKIRLRDATADFGRFWIAKLLQAVEMRMLDQDKLPIFAYIDEAEEYIRNESNIEEIVDRARKQKLSLTVAIKEESQISGAGVLAALKRMAIRTELSKPPAVEVIVNGEPISLQVPNLDLTHEPTMSNAQWHQVLDAMHERYCVPPAEREPEAVAMPAMVTAAPEEETIRPIKDW